MPLDFNEPRFFLSSHEVIGILGRNEVVQKQLWITRIIGFALYINIGNLVEEEVKQVHINNKIHLFTQQICIVY